MRKTFLSLGIRAVLMSGVLAGMLPLGGQAQSLGLYPAAAVDTDHDRLSDAEELTLGTNPSLVDTDGDYLSDSDEVFVTGTDPLLADSDLDGLTDYEEWAAQFPEPVVLDPDNYYPQLDDLWWPVAHLTDYDMDGISDREEVMYGNPSYFHYKNTVRSTPVNGQDEDSEIWGSPDHWHPTDYDRDGLNATQETAWQTDPYDPDTDGDGLRDGVDAMLGDPLLADSNANGVNDREELMAYAHYSLNASSSLLDLLGDTPPGTMADGDRDGMSDLWELANGLNPSDTLDAYDDPDGDFLFNIEEYRARSNPQALLSTAAQAMTIDAINPTTQLLETRAVVNDYEAVMGVPVPAGMVRDNGPISGYEYDDDWDGDGYKNRDEVLATPARNPRFDESQDTDGDGLLDTWETLKGLDKDDADENNNSVSDGLDDFDNDQLNNLGEQSANTNPQQADTDGDTLPDGWEVTKGLNALNGDQDSNSTADSEDDFDSDQLTNAEELTLGTHPLRADTDFDGLPDAWELANQLNPNSASGINGGAGDADGDGFSNVAEMNAGSSPQSTGSTPPATFIFKSWSAQAEGYGDDPSNYQAWVTSMAEPIDEEDFPYSTNDPIPKANEAAEWAEDTMKGQDYAEASVTPWTSYDTKQFPGGDVRWDGLTPHIVAVKSEFIWIGHEFYADYRRVRLEVQTPVAAAETRSYLVLTETEASDSLEVVGSVEFALDAGQTKAAVTVDSALSQHGVTAAPDGKTLCIEPPPSTLTVDGYFKKSVYLIPINLKIWNGQGAISEVSKKTSVGAFTVANLNDTDGNGTIDTNDTHVPGEKDLMKLYIGGYSGLTGSVKLSVKNGSVKFWENADKQTEIPQQNGAVFFTIPAGGMNKTLWVEATAVSANVRDIEIWEGYLDSKGKLKDGTDKVKATAIWVDPGSNAITNSGTTPLQHLDDTTAVSTFQNGHHSRFGIFDASSLTPPLQQFSFSIGFAFKVKPAGIGNEPGVKFDISRQKENFYWIKDSNGWFDALALPNQNPNPKMTFPLVADAPNDDGLTFDEDNVPNSDHIYSLDNPATGFQQSPPFIRLVKRANFREFVRVRLDGTAFANQNQLVEGSRCSNFQPWRMRCDLSASGGVWSLTSGGSNELQGGHVSLGTHPTP